MRANSTFGLLAVATGVVVGCAGSNVGDREAVKGQVTFQAKPLDQGVISFTPKDGATGTFGGATITDGVYDVPAENGLDPGVYEVRITSAEGGTEVVEEVPGEAPPPAKERIPPEFNEKTTLEFTVKKGEVNEFNVDIP
jgi:hypothetical protein